MGDDDRWPTFEVDSIPYKISMWPVAFGSSTREQISYESL